MCTPYSIMFCIFCIFCLQDKSGTVSSYNTIDMAKWCIVKIVSWEPEGGYCSSNKMCSVENQKGTIAVQSLMAIAPFWFSTEHHWTAITPLQLLTVKIYSNDCYFHHWYECWYRNKCQSMIYVWNMLVLFLSFFHFALLYNWVAFVHDFEHQNSLSVNFLFLSISLSIFILYSSCLKKVNITDLHLTLYCIIFISK